MIFDRKLLRPEHERELQALVIRAATDAVTALLGVESVSMKAIDLHQMAASLGRLFAGAHGMDTQMAELYAITFFNTMVRQINVW